MPGDLSPTTTQPSSSFLIRKGIYIGLALIAGTGVARLLEYAGEHPYPGALRSRVTLVSSNCLAQVRDVSVKAGQTLSPGDSLVQLVDSKLEDRIISKRREIAELEAEMIRVKIAAEVDLAWRRRELESEVFETQLKETALTQERLNKQVEQLAWKDYLACVDVLISPIGAATDDPFRSLTKELQLPDERRLQSMLREDAAAASAETLSIQITLCQERLARLAALEKNLEQKIRAGSGVDVIEAKLKGAQLELAALEGQSKDLIVRSPTYGTVGDVKVNTGDQIPGGGALVEIMDDVQRHVVAEVPPGTAAKLQHGSKVTLVFPENDRRIGIIAEIPSQVTMSTGHPSPFVAVKIEPAGKVWPKLAIGANVKVLLP